MALKYSVWKRSNGIVKKNTSLLKYDAQKIHLTKVFLLKKKRNKNSGLTLDGAGGEILTLFLPLAVPYTCFLSYVKGSQWLFWY